MVLSATASLFSWDPHCRELLASLPSATPEPVWCRRLLSSPSPPPPALSAQQSGRSKPKATPKYNFSATRSCPWITEELMHPHLTLQPKGRRRLEARVLKSFLSGTLVRRYKGQSTHCTPSTLKSFPQRRQGFRWSCTHRRCRLPDLPRVLDSCAFSASPSAQCPRRCSREDPAG